jgi:hypothetical protein
MTLFTWKGQLVAKTARVSARTNGRPVIVCTEHRGVFFGYAADTTGETISLKRVRNCIYWDSSCKGFLGLATDGPGPHCRIGPAADQVELRKITCVVEVSPAAVKQWEVAPWEE